MMPALLVLALGFQASTWRVTPVAPTVGDTIVLERFIPAAPGAVARMRPLDGNDLVEPLGPPVATTVQGGVRVHLTVALFAPGLHAVAMPAIELTHPDGTVEAILGDTAVVEVAPVIPDSLVHPRPMPSQPPLARPVRNLARAVVPAAFVAVLLLAWLAWWRRAPRPMAPPSAERAAQELPLMRWLSTGERRAVATLARERLRLAVVDCVPTAAVHLAHDDWIAAVRRAEGEWPVDELAALATALERARFAPLAGDDLAELVDRVDVVVARMGSPPSEVEAGAR
jgi:hypothetical protein